MTESIIITLIICVSATFSIFTFCAVWGAALKDKHGNEKYITREEFEEYEHMVNERFDRCLIREKR